MGVIVGATRCRRLTAVAGRAVWSDQVEADRAGGEARSVSGRVHRAETGTRQPISVGLNMSDHLPGSHRSTIMNANMTNHPRRRR